MSTVERFTKINRDTEVSADARGKTVQVTELVRLSRAGRTSWLRTRTAEKKTEKRRRNERFVTCVILCVVFCIVYFNEYDDGSKWYGNKWSLYSTLLLVWVVSGSVYWIKVL